MFSYTIWEWFAFFIIYCMVGWIVESVFVSFQHKKFVNRGFLHGPFLPIYGFGAVIILLSTIHVRQNFFLIFLFGMLGATLLEYITGYIMDTIFHVKYWDYSDTPFNLNGYICLKCSLAWGVYSIFLTGFIHKPIENIVLSIPQVWLMTVDIIFSIYLILDLISSSKRLLTQ